MDLNNGQDKNANEEELVENQKNLNHLATISTSSEDHLRKSENINDTQNHNHDKSHQSVMQQVGETVATKQDEELLSPDEGKRLPTRDSTLVDIQETPTEQPKHHQHEPIHPILAQLFGDPHGKQTKREVKDDWGGENKSHCSFRFIHGPDRVQFYSVIFMIIIPCISYTLFVGVDLWERVSPALFIIPLYFFVSTLALLLVAAFSDPGVVPRNRNWKKINTEEETNEIIFKFKQRLRTSKKKIRINDASYSLKFCTTCNIYQPLRTHHCRTCDSCVEGFDHHCPWIGNCVGKMNYRYFLYFVFSVIILATLILAGSVVELALLINDRRNDDDVDPGWDIFINSRGYIREIFSGILIIYSFGVLIAVGTLLFYHCFLQFTGLKTYEHIRGKYKDKRNPFQRGCVRNWFVSLFPPTYMSYVRADLKERTRKNGTVV